MKHKITTTSIVLIINVIVNIVTRSNTTDMMSMRSPNTKLLIMASVNIIMTNTIRMMVIITYPMRKVEVCRPMGERDIISRTNQ